MSNWFLDWNLREVFNETYLNYKREYENGIEQRISNDILIELDKKAILYPTPNQTEQEYLAEYLSKKNIFLV